MCIRDRYKEWVRDNGLTALYADRDYPTFVNPVDVATYDIGWIVAGREIHNNHVPDHMELHLGKAFMLDFDGHGEYYAQIDLTKVEI